MATLTTMQLAWLLTGWLLLSALLVLGVVVVFPRSRRLVPTRVMCPMLNAPVMAQLVRDEWTRGFTAVSRCEPLGRCARVLCDERCLRDRAASPLAGAS